MLLASGPFGLGAVECSELDVRLPAPLFLRQPDLSRCLFDIFHDGTRDSIRGAHTQEGSPSGAIAVS